MKSFIILLCIVLPFSLYSQTDINKAVREAEQNICNCTKETLIKNGVNVTKLGQISNIYKKNNKMPNSELANVNRLYTQINSKINNIVIGIQLCRKKFTSNPKFKPYFSNQLFKNKLEKALDNNNYYYGPKLIQKLATKR